MTAEEYKVLTGRAPVEDDLERVNCSKAGSLGHHYCGVCPCCKQPRFACECKRDI